MRPRTWSARILRVVLVLGSTSSSAAAQNPGDPSCGVELDSPREGVVIRFPVIHQRDGGRRWDVGYLHFSANDVRYQVVYPVKDKEYSFRYPRTDLVPGTSNTGTREYYDATRLEFKDGHAYTFACLRRLILPADDLLQAASQFEAALAAAGAKANQRDSGLDADPLMFSSGDILSGNNTHILRFVVAHEGEGSAFSSCGYLYFSERSIRYEVLSGPSTEGFTFDRSALSNSKEEWGSAELQFSHAKHRFVQYLPVLHYLPAQGAEKACEIFGKRAKEWIGLHLPIGPYGPVLEAAISFPAALANAELINRRVLSRSTAVEMAILNQKLAAWRTAGARVDLPEEAVRHRVLAEAAFQEKDFGKAASAYEEALVVYPTWPEGQFNAALMLGELHRYADAVVHMKAYLELTPDAPDAQKATQQIWIWEDKMK
jgi:tetratricopeptide (TPR) repeat protein